jgi:RNA polymerase sigma-70 factor (ECF subfamily)
MRFSPQRTAARQADFSSLHERHSREVWALAYARCLNSETALDVTQEAFLRLWKQWRAGELIDNPRAWLLRVARNLAEDTMKSAFHRNGTQLPEVMNGVAARERLPIEALQRDETLRQVRRVLAQLPGADRDILTLRYALDYDTQRIAETLSIQATAVHMRLSRARQRMAQALEMEGVHEVL